MNTTYRKYHNSLMHSNGTSAWETFLAVIPIFTYEYIGTTLASLFVSLVTQKKKWLFLFEFCIIIEPLVHLSFLNKHLSEVFLYCSLTIFTSILLIHNFKDNEEIKQKEKKCHRLSTSFLTNFRAAINIASVLCILAVDFQIFPRRFTKTETFGFSLMDIGVGLYMIANGIVVPELSGKYNTILKSVTSSIPLFVLGGLRFFITKETDYLVPISEYGVHWNFFITLGVTKILTTVLMRFIKVAYIGIVAVLVLITHEVLLQNGLAKFVLNNQERTNFIVANKEGLVSSLGYVSLYLFAVQIGYVFDVKQAEQNKIKTVLKIFGTSLLMLLSTSVLETQFGISRRLLNSTFCTWSLFMGSTLIGLYFTQQCFYDFVLRNKLPYCVNAPYIFKAVNYNGLPFFLLSNILTGIINMFCNTLEVNDGTAFLILTGYMLINCLFVCILYHKRIKLKL